MNARIMEYKRDTEFTKEGCEHSPAYWQLILSQRRYAELERDFEVALLQQERAEFIRRVKDNDKPGKRHMLPFVWSKGRQVLLRKDTPQFDYALDKINAKIKAARGK